MKLYNLQDNKLVTFILSVFLTVLSAPNALAQDGSKVTVQTDTLNVRKGPGIEYGIKTAVHRGESYASLEHLREWVKIRLKDDSEGWVVDWLVSTSPEETVTTVQSAVDGLNVRSGPSITFPIISQMNQGDAFPLVNKEGDWVELRLSDRVTGWVSSQFLSLDQQKKSEATTSSINKVKIVSNVLNVRKEPTTASASLGQLSQGDIVSVLDVRNDWLKVQLGNDSGWVASWLVRSIGSASTDASTNKQSNNNPSINRTSLSVSSPKVKIINAATNLRSGPGPQHAILYRANIGETFPIVSSIGDWFEIQLPSRKKAFVAGWIVTASGMNPIIKPALNSYLKGKVIVIDPGHGGRDVGATGAQFETLEKYINLQVAKLLKTKLEAAGARIYMTRETDETLTLDSRVYLSSKHKADLFVSIHHNTNENARISGLITYYYSGEKERRLANLVEQSLVKETGFKDLKARQGDYFVLRENTTVSILCELGFLTNYRDELIIRSKNYQENAAEGIFKGILQYFDKRER